jgi:hypothetical protein
MNGIPMINGFVYSWADIVVTINGVPVTGVRAIKYAENRTTENVYGVGSYPVGRGKGRIEPTASITLLMDELVAISDSAPFQRIDDIAPFDIIVSYTPANSAKIRHDVIKNAQFKSNSRDWTEGDTSEEVELELVISHIVFGKS